MSVEATIVASSTSKLMNNYGAGGYAAIHNAATAIALNAYLQILQIPSGENYSIGRGAILFDTSSIPATAVISSAIMQVYQSGEISDERAWDIVIRNGQPTYPHNPVVVGDYLYSNYAGDGGSITVSTITPGAWNNITMNATGRGWIQTGAGAITKLALISSKDISSTAPTVTEHCTFASYASIRLVITYTTTPTVTVQAPTLVLPTTVTANGNITDTGGLDCTVRGFEYGLTQTATWDVYDEGTYSTGAYTKALTSLTANTIYWIRAFTTNSVGTSYSEWIQFQTAASGTIPTGTLINICSDYSGYTYRSMRAETDDGLPYTAYFVISTDMSNKQALAFYKRILDLHLYLKSEDSGTLTIEVKRDNEATWQSVGSADLTGTADIIIKHLAVRIYGKHFLFKVSASNYFRFLGCLFEFLPGGMR